jgi:hypothetical protein
MKEINPHLARFSPRDALTMLHEQLKAYAKSYSPFNQKKKENESLRDWWSRLVKFDKA